MIMTRQIRLQGISFAYPGSSRPLFDALDFALPKDRRIGLIGPNGSGKTTLLRIMVGLLKPHAGEVLLDDVPCENDKDFLAVRRMLGFLFQHADDQLFSPTVLEDVAFGPLNLGKSPAEAEKISLETLERLNLQGFEERITHKLSGGEKRLVSLAAVLAMGPEALLLDEPTNGLDPETRDKIIGLLNELHLPGIVVSHDWEFLQAVSDDVYTLRNGRIAKGDKEKIFHQHVHAHDHGDLPHKHLP